MKVDRVMLVVLAVAFIVAISLLLSRGDRSPNVEQVVVTTPEPEITPITIVLDPGHGGRDPGGVTEGILEKELNLAIVERMQTLIDLDYPELDPVLTRTMDIEMDNLDRVNRAKETGAALYVSIHVNACEYPEVSGAEVWVDETLSEGDGSWILARCIQDAVVAATGTRDRGIRTGDLYLQHLAIPAVSVEVGFLTCAEERAKLIDPGYQEQIAGGIIQGIMTYLETVGYWETGDQDV
jgi:N-acetylmuramoyl-L-alanine amidase